MVDAMHGDMNGDNRGDKCIVSDTLLTLARGY